MTEFFEKFFKVVCIILLFIMIIYYFVVGIWEKQVLISVGKYIESSPEYFYLESIMMGLIGAVIVTGLAWGVLFVIREWNE
jgi:ABC-type Fe3+ transport system permease subunit